MRLWQLTLVIVTKGDTISLLKRKKLRVSSSKVLLSLLSVTLSPLLSLHFLLLPCKCQDVSRNLTTFSLTSQGDWASPAKRIRQPGSSTPHGKLFKLPLLELAGSVGTGHAGNRFNYYFISSFFSSLLMLCCCHSVHLQTLRSNHSPLSPASREQVDTPGSPQE